nr:energy-coupling factor ABC transporter permease [Oceanococcus sp. HetDA_MAG_MS8]
MSIDPSLIPLSLHIVAGLCCLLSLGLAGHMVPWRALKDVPQRQHLLFGSLASLLLLWTLSIEAVSGVHIHLLGMTTLTLLMGWPIAIIGGTLVLLIQLLMSPLSLLALPLSWLLTVAIPATTTRLLVVVLRNRGQPNPYLFLLGAGFGGGILSALFAASACGALFALLGLGGWPQTLQRDMALLALAAFPEGFLNGVVMTAITVVNPEWVKTFDERYYQASDQE